MNTPSSRGLRAGFALLLGAGLLFTAGCASTPAEPETPAESESTAGTKVSEVAFVAAEDETDFGWNRQGLSGALNATEELGIKLLDFSGAGYQDPTATFTKVAEEGPDLIIAHGDVFHDAAHDVALELNVPTLVTDVDHNEEGTVASVLTQGYEGAYLAGFLAAQATETNTVGIVSSDPNESFNLMAGGFAQGVYSVNPEITVLLEYVGTSASSYSDAAGGKATTEQLIADGADVIFGLGGSSVSGYVEAVETAAQDSRVLYISAIAASDDLVENEDILLGRLVWDFTQTYLDAIADVEAGTFGSKTYELTLENGGVAFGVFTDSEFATEEISALGSETKRSIVDGTITVEETPTEEAVREIIAAQGK